MCWKKIAQYLSKKVNKIQVFPGLIVETAIFRFMKECDLFIFNLFVVYLTMHLVMQNIYSLKWLT
jgi:hypothetical protein